MVEQGAERPEYQGMTMRDVTFGYGSSAHTFGNRTPGSSSKPVLNHVSLDVPQHGILGIQGPSGRGKSTMLKLLMRYWDPDSGTISLSHIPLPQVDAGWRRRVQTMMGQETPTFLTVRFERISLLPAILLIPQRPPSPIPYCARRSPRHPRSSWSMRYRTAWIRRLASWAAAFRRARNSASDWPACSCVTPIWCSSTSRLDAYNESVILGSVNNLAEQGSAVVLVSHRDSTMCVADRILRM